MFTKDKIFKLTRLHNRKALALAAGISYAALDSAIRGHSELRISTAAKLAAVLGVDLGWMVDDTKGWPPVRTAPAMDGGDRKLAA